MDTDIERIEVKMMVKAMIGFHRHGAPKVGDKYPFEPGLLT